MLHVFEASAFDTFSSVLEVNSRCVSSRHEMRFLCCRFYTFLCCLMGVLLVVFKWLRHVFNGLCFVRRSYCFCVESQSCNSASAGSLSLVVM